MSSKLPIHIETISAQADQKSALATLLHSLEGDLTVQAMECLQRAVFEREETSSTYLEDGLAIPHGRIAQLEGPIVAVGVQPLGIDWPVPENRARLIVLLGVPASMIGGYLQLVQKLLRWRKASSLVAKDGSVAALDSLKRELEQALR